ncbi:phenylacetate--CoA ligase family protein, partial [Neptuniibacter sp. UBA6509]
TAEVILDFQLKQAQSLLYVAQRSVPLYQDRIPKISGALNREQWEKIPVLSREELVGAKAQLINKKPLKGHDQLNEITTSGSTGMPITAYGTQVTRAFWDAFTLREHLWHKRDFSGKLISIRPEQGEPGKPLKGSSWGGGAAAVFKTGPAGVLNSRTDISAQLEWLQAENPEYLLSLPSILSELALKCEEQQIELPNLKQIRSYGELLTQATRDICQRVWKVDITDVYSTQEVGYIAMQCPEQGNYHIQSEGLMVEILDEDDRPCNVGETGRVVVTTLLNFGAPLIRYAVGDYAQLGEPCGCGRGMPVIQKIMGRQRNMMKTPDGRTHWPSFPASYWNLDKIKQLQLVQKALDTLLIRLVVTAPLDENEEGKLKALFIERFEYPFICEFEYLDSISRTKGGKYEDFMSMVD